MAEILILSFVIGYVIMIALAIIYRPKKNRLLYWIGCLLTFILPSKTPSLVEMDKSLPSFENQLYLCVGSLLLGIFIMFLVSLFNSGQDNKQNSDGIKLN